MKICAHCNLQKPLDAFGINRHSKDGLGYYCRACKNQKSRDWSRSNPEKNLASKARYRSANREAANRASREWQKQNPERVKEHQALWRAQNIERARERARRWDANHADKRRKYRLKNPDKTLARVKRWQERNPDLVRALRVEYEKRRRSEPAQRARDAIARRLRHVLKGTGYKSGARTEDIVGYGVEELRAHLQAQFCPGMEWGNYGSEWHIDHIRPVASFDFSENAEEVVRQCWALSNLAPLWGAQNMSKGAKWPGLHLPSRMSASSRGT